MYFFKVKLLPPVFSAGYGHEKSFKELGDLGHQLFNFQKACIDTEIVVKLIAPAAVGVKFVIFRTLLVDVYKRQLLMLF